MRQSAVDGVRGAGLSSANMIIDGESSGINVASSTVTFLGDKNILAANFPNTQNTDSSLNDIGGVMRAS